MSQLVGLVVLGGWWLGIERIVQPLPGLPAMVPNTALCAILLGTSLLLLRGRDIPSMRRWVAGAFAVLVLGLTALTLAEYATGLDLHVDDVFFRTLPEDTALDVRRSGLGSAAAFVLIGLSLLTVDVRAAVRNDLSELLAIGAALVGLVILAGYVYGAHSLYAAATLNAGVAVHTIVVVFVLSIGVMCLRPDRPIIALVTSPGAGGFAIRRLLVGTWAIPTIGLLIVLGLHRSLYDEPFAAALLAVASMATAIALVLATGHALERADAARTASEHAVAEREERLRYLIQQASDGVFVADIDGPCIEVNDALCGLVGRRREEIIGRKVREFVRASDLPRFEMAKAALRRGEAQVDEWTLRRPDGSDLPVEVSAKILPDGRWQGLVRDISARRRVERAGDAVAEAITVSPQSSLQAVLQTIALEAKVVTNAEYAALGFDGDREHPFEPWVVAGMSPDEAARLGRPPRPVGLLGLVAGRKHPLRVPDVAKHPAFRGLPPNHPRMTSFLGVPIRRRGRSIGNVFLANKIGAVEFTVADERAVERLAARAAIVIETARLYEAEGLERTWLAMVIDQMPEGVILTDATGGNYVENRSMQAFASETFQHDPRGQQVRYDLRLPNGQPLPLEDQPQMRALVEETTTIARELLMRHPDGRMVPMLVSATPVFDAQGKRRGAVTIYQDISTLKELERLREEWSSVVAHDLRQPVGIIALEAEGLSRSVDCISTPDVVKAIDRILRSTTRLNKMIDDLLDVSRIEARRLTLERTDTNLSSFLEDAVDRLSFLAPGHPIAFRPQVTQAFVSIDPVRFDQIVGNLISNAAKYGPPGDPIAVELDAHDSEFEVSVTNHGAGIAPADQPTVFQRFARSKMARGSDTPGLGLGLYICKGLVEAHGGRIWVDSIPGETTTFHFTIPKLTRSARAPAEGISDAA